MLFVDISILLRTRIQKFLENLHEKVFYRLEYDMTFLKNKLYEKKKICKFS